VAPANESDDNRGDNKPSETAHSTARLSTSDTGSFDRYVNKAFFREKHKLRFAYTPKEFLVSVQAELLLELKGDVQELRKLQDRIEAAMAEDRRLISKGLEATNFKNLPDRRQLVKAIRKGIRDDQRPKSESDQGTVDPATSVQPVDQLLWTETVDLVFEALGKLDPQDQQILQLCKLEHMKPRDVVKLLKIPTSTLYRRLKRSISKLDNAMSRHLRE